MLPAEVKVRNLEARHSAQVILTAVHPTKMSFFRLATRSLSRPTFASARIPTRYVPRARYSASAGLSKEVIQARVLDVLKGFEKVNQSKVRPSCFILSPVFNLFPAQLSPTASFANDLGLDSLDAVEVMMAVEEVQYRHNDYSRTSSSGTSRAGILDRNSRR